MSGLLESVAVVMLVGTVFALVALFVAETWLLAWEQHAPSPFVRALYRVGIDARRMASPAAACEIAAAEQCCPTCPVIGSCREWLESGSPEAYRRFCPNAALVERLTH
jgi:hypothetical protein